MKMFAVPDLVLSRQPSEPRAALDDLPDAWEVRRIEVTTDPHYDRRKAERAKQHEPAPVSVKLSSGGAIRPMIERVDHLSAKGRDHGVSRTSGYVFAQVQV
jgi:hypothetical protein